MKQHDTYLDLRIHTAAIQFWKCAAMEEQIRGIFTIS